MKIATEKLNELVEAVKREKAAAQAAAAALDGVRESIEKMDAPGQRRKLVDAREAFEALTRFAAMRNSLAIRFAISVGLKRDETVAGIAAALGEAAAALKAVARELMEELNKVRVSMKVLALLTKYGEAMTASLMDIRGAALKVAPYGRNGHRTACLTRRGQLA